MDEIGDEEEEYEYEESDQARQRRADNYVEDEDKESDQARTRRRIVEIWDYENIAPRRLYCYEEGETIVENIKLLKNLYTEIF